MKPRPETLARLRIIREMVELGYSDSQIAAHLGLKKDTAAAFRRRHGIPVAPTPITHGTATGYTHHGCRCEACTTANTERAQQQRAARYARREEADFKHGLSGYSNWGCRCQVCRQAQSKAYAVYRERAAKAGAA
jgi:hypothetical protein